MRVPNFISNLENVILPEIDLALSIAGTLGKDAGLLVDDVLNKCSRQRKRRQDTISKDSCSSKTFRYASQILPTNA